MNETLQGPNSVSSQVSAGVLGHGGEGCLLACAEEEAIAFRYNGFAHGVMMATPADMEEFALGFSLTEGVIDAASDVSELSIASSEDGIAIDISLRGAILHR